MGRSSYCGVRPLTRNQLNNMVTELIRAVNHFIGKYAHKAMPIKLEEQNMVTELIRAVNHFIGKYAHKATANQIRETKCGY